MIKNISTDTAKFLMGKNIFLIVFLASTIMTFGFNKDTLADKTRDCKAAYEITNRVIVYKFGSGDPRAKITVGGTEGDPQKWWFSASGKDNTANNARKEAQRNAHECMETHWDRRNLSPERPEACSSGNRVTRYSAIDIKLYIDRRACEFWTRTGDKTDGGGSLTLDIYRKTWGKNQCDHTRQLNDSKKPFGYVILKERCDEIL